MDRRRISSHAPLILLFAINTLNFLDRQIFAAVAEPLRHEFNLSDLQIGWLGTSFILFYAMSGLPLGRLADLRPRKFVLASGIAAWSLLTSVSGFSRGFWEFFTLRLGVGIGEATCAPSSLSLIGDLYKPEERGRALSIFMLGLPLGITLSYLVGGSLAQRFGWRSTYLVAGMPGLLLAVMSLLLPEPPRGFSEITGIGKSVRTGSPWKVVLHFPTMWWIIVSGALHNFNLYAISYFLPAFLVRYHKTTFETAGFISAVVIGCVGGTGMLVGGWFGDRLSLRHCGGRMLLVMLATLTSVPALYVAMSQGTGELPSFLVFLGLAWFLMYTYYPNVYSTLQELLEPALRGTGTSVYFFAMYVLGALWGPVATGWMSDAFARQAAQSAGQSLHHAAVIPEQFKAMSLHHALLQTPVVSALLTLVLFAGWLTARRDIEKLRRNVALDAGPVSESGQIQ